jgi:hypothetical protein
MEGSWGAGEISGIPRSRGDVLQLSAIVQADKLHWAKPVLKLITTTPKIAVQHGTSIVDNETSNQKSVAIRGGLFQV